MQLICFFVLMSKTDKYYSVELCVTPLCEMCLKEDKVVSAKDIHHIVSFMSTDDPEQRISLAYDYENLMSLCKQCH